MGARLGPVDGGRLEFTVDGAPFALDVPADGLAVCGWAADGQWIKLVPGCLADDCRAEFEALLDDPGGPYGLRVCWRLAHGLATEVYGTEWWVAARLSATARENWLAFSTWAVTAGFDPSSAPAHRVCAGALAWLQTTVEDEKEARRLEAKLFTPPRPTRKNGKSAPGFTKADQAASWEAALATLGSSG